MTKKKIDILYVEDNPVDVTIIERGLKKSGIVGNITIIDDGKKAESYLMKRATNEPAITPDIIILDLALPKIHGLDLLKSIKSNNKLKSIPVIILTNSNSNHDILSSYKGYANCFINKTNQLEEIDEMLSVVLDFWTNSAVLPTKNID